MPRGAWAVVALCIAGCSNDQGPRAPALGDFGFGSEQTYPGCEDIDFSSCFVDEAPCRQRVYDAVTCARGDQSGEAPPVELVDVRELAEILAAEDDPTPPKDPDFDAALVALGLIDPSVLVEDDVEVEVGGIAGLFIPHSERVILVKLRVEETWPVIAVQVLAHEYVHYLQNREYEENLIEASIGAPYDEWLAAVSLVEGEAAVYDAAVGGVFSGVRYDDQLDATLLDNVIKSTNETVAELGFPMLYSRGVFPYLHGMAFCAEAWRNDGPDGIRALFGDPARATRELLVPGEPFDRSTIVSTQLPAAPDGWEAVGTDTAGAWALFGAIGPIVGDADAAWDVALDWRGDTIGAYRKEGALAAVWRIEVAALERASGVADRFDGSSPGGDALDASSNGTAVTVLAAPPGALGDEWRTALGLQ